eukprot:NODE_802_length_1184_cov_86.855251_g761_i0.p1 GENE.NODE_802_length_1184_cov_86.855251_g761_i0~~NODE_802_length_1184_cov_86.855251_g761_i0.p1  ORF type:complete len:284 (+),score=33.62 NODE_802_length_1184_cov_86.855251_g761_i0:244-1095(+)
MIRNRVPPRFVLLTNDDGPPGKASQFFGPFLEAFDKTLKWRRGVCLPAANKSWISKAHTVHDPIDVTHYHDSHDGTPWTLLTATPATAVNVGIHNLFPSEKVDLVLSGPNFGRNVSRVFISASGTVGAALEGCVCGKKAIALSFCMYKDAMFEKKDIAKASALALQIIARLWEVWPPGVDLFNINVPCFKDMQPELAVYATDIHENSYQENAPLYKILDKDGEGPARLRFMPDVSKYFPNNPPVNSDAWATENKFVSITPMSKAGVSLSLTSLSPHSHWLCNL